MMGNVQLCVCSNKVRLTLQIINQSVPLLREEEEEEEEGEGC